MSKTTTHPFKCLKTGTQATLSRTVFRGISGIGDDAAGVHTEHACSLERTCAYRTEPSCPVRRLDAQTRLLQGPAWYYSGSTF
ncbi:MAG TPA: hypothetical protein VFG03_17045 [Telluria sp.]|nr:hypothetical protein [Telluria sp.]